MDTLWQAGYALDVESVHARVAPNGRPVRNTIQSTLERLVRKGLAHRTKHGRAYHYTASVERRDWFAGAVGALAKALRSRSSQDLLAGFVDFADPVLQFSLFGGQLGSDVGRQPVFASLAVALGLRAPLIGGCRLRGVDGQ